MSDDEKVRWAEFYKSDDPTVLSDADLRGYLRRYVSANVDDIVMSLAETSVSGDAFPEMVGEALAERLVWLAGGLDDDEPSAVTQHVSALVDLGCVVFAFGTEELERANTRMMPELSPFSPAELARLPEHVAELPEESQRRLRALLLREIFDWMLA